MKKFLSFAMALAMTASLVPATAFASSDATISKVITAEDDDNLYDGGDFDGERSKKAPVLTLEAKSNFKDEVQEFEVQLENAEWLTEGKDEELVLNDKDIVVHYNGEEDKTNVTTVEKLQEQLAEAETDKSAAWTALATAVANGSSTIDVEDVKDETVTAALGYIAKAAEKATVDSEIATLEGEIAAEDAAYQIAKADVADRSDANGDLDWDYDANGDGTGYIYHVTANDKTSARDIDVYAAGLETFNDNKEIVEAMDTKVDALVQKKLESNELQDELDNDYSQFDNGANLVGANIETEDTGLKAVYDEKVELIADLTEAIENGGSVVEGEVKVEVTKKGESSIIVRLSGKKLTDGDEVDIPLYTNLTGGTATVSVDHKNSEFTSETKTFAKTVDGSTKFSTEGVINFQDGDELKDFFIEEITPGTFEDGEVTVTVRGGFEFKKDAGKIEVIAGTGKDTKTISVKEWKDDEFKFDMPYADKSTDAVQIRFSGFKLDEGDADYGDVAELKINGGGVSKETIEVGTYTDYGIKMEAEDKELPVIYAGTKADNDNENKTLKVVIEETVAGSFIADRKLELKLPEGVEFSDDNHGIDDSSKSFKTSNFSEKLSEDDFELKGDDASVLKLDHMPKASGDKKRKVEIAFNITAEADFTGDVDLTLTGPGVSNEEITTTIATVKAPIEVKADVNELKLDYRNTEASEITLVEPAAGTWNKGDKIFLEVENMKFESGIEAEVVSGDMKLEKLDGDNVEVEKGKGNDAAYIMVRVDKESNKEPAEIKISGIKLYMERNLPAGDYELTVRGDKENDMFMNNYDKDGDDKANAFETEDITVLEDYVKVVTAGRDQDDATFTTKITVPVGADKIMAGTKEIALDAPAYINKDGYTMLPVRAVTEALNGVAAIKWDDATKTATINFGQRVFSMTVNSKVMNINGVQTNLLAAPEIKNERIFLPLRDLGYALGLQDDKINWDSATSTATLN